MLDVTVGGPGLVAVGFNGNAPGGAVVWTSIDGISWSLVRPDDTIYGEGMSAVTAGGPGLVAVGEGSYPGTGTGGFSPVWTSTDGVTWSRVPDVNNIFDFTGMSDVIAGGPGLIAVGGVESLSPYDVDAAVWVWED